MLHHDVDIVLVLEDVQQTDNVWVLTHLEHLNFAPLKFDIGGCHFLFRHDFDGDLLASLLVDSRFNKAKLTLTEGASNIIKIKQVGVADNSLDRTHPLFLVFGCQQVVHANFVGGKDQLKRVQHRSGVKLLLNFVFNKNTD